MSNRRHSRQPKPELAPLAAEPARLEPRPFTAHDQPAADVQSQAAPAGAGHDFGQVQSPGTPLRIQAKLMVGPAGDHYEQEADRLAAQVLNMPMPAGDAAVAADVAAPLAVQRAGGDAGFEAGANIESTLSTRRGGGAALPAATRAFMEPRFGADFSGVRVHTDGEAADMNRQLSARAFTHGQDIYLGAGSYAPGSSEGQRLLAHELTHVVQQSSAQIQRQYLDRPAATATPLATHVVTRQTIQRFSEHKLFYGADPAKYLDAKFKSYASWKVRSSTRNARIAAIITAIKTGSTRPHDDFDYAETVVTLFNKYFVKKTKGKGAQAYAEVESDAEVHSLDEVLARIGAAADEGPADIDQDALEAQAKKLGLSEEDIERLKKLKDAKEGKFSFITSDGEALSLDIKARKIKIGWGAGDDAEGDSLEISKDKVALSIGGYGVSCEQKPDGQAAALEFPELRAPAEGGWGPAVSLKFPLDPAGITDVGVRLSLTGFVSLKPSLRATKTTDRATGDRTYAITGDVTPGGEISAMAEVFAGAGAGGDLMRIEGGLFGRGSVKLKDSESTISIAGTYIDHTKRGTNEGSLVFTPDLKGAITAEAGAYARWSLLFASKRYEYIFKEWEMGDIAYKQSATLNVAEGTGWRPPNLAQSFKPNIDSPIPFERTVTDVTTPLLSGTARSDS